MNKTIRRIFAGSLLAALLLAGCGREKETPTVRIGVALYQQEDTFISTVVQQLEQLARAEEQRRGIKINLNLADARSSQSAQNEQVDRFLQQGYDMLCVNLVDRTAAAVIVDKAQAADVPVVFFNREPVEEDLARWDRAYYVGSPAATAGTLQGKIVLDAWREDPASIDRNGDGVIQYVMLEGEPGHQDALMRTEYSVKALMTAAVPVEKLANDNANWERGQASLRMEQWLREFGDAMEVVFANNDDMALAAARTAKDNPNYAKTIFLGFDGQKSAVEAVLNGELTMTAAQNNFDIGYKAVETIVKIMNGEEYGDVATGTEIITKDNAQARLDNFANSLK